MKTIEFQKKILGWYRQNGRQDLPWRLEGHYKDPYKVLVSEIMLQQTQVDRVRSKYRSFLRRFPTIVSLARANILEVLREWQGLGYNRRALYLQRAARVIIEEFQGRFPKETSGLERLSGVGPYTARAIRVFAWSRPEVFIETNIRRVFIHFFFSNSKKISERKIADKKILPLVVRTLYIKNPRVWYWALMDYGREVLSKHENPNRRSAHYTRQSPFRGSHRELRARVLAFALTKSRGFKTRDASRICKNPQAILLDLERDGFLRLKNKMWQVRTH